MKFLLLLAVLAANQTQASKLGMVNPLAFQCFLSVEVSPLEYIFVSRSMSIRLRFSSNCLRLRDFIFEVPFTLKDRLSKEKHPKILELNINRNRYRFTFSKSEETDKKTILRKYSYERVSLTPSTRPSSKNVDTTRFNRLFLEEKRKGSFGVRRLNNLLYTKNPIRCDVNTKLTIMKCQLK